MKSTLTMKTNPKMKMTQKMKKITNMKTIWKNLGKYDLTISGVRGSHGYKPYYFWQVWFLYPYPFYFDAHLVLPYYIRVIPCETTEKKLDVPKIVSNFLGPIVSPNEE